jgi:hypothetical protein
MTAFFFVFFLQVGYLTALYVSRQYSVSERMWSGWWNENWQGKLKYWEKIRQQCHFNRNKSHMN